MKKMKTLMRALLLVLCFAMVISLSACTADMSIGDNTELGEQFMNNLIDNKRDDAYELIKNTVTPDDFDAYWSTIRPIVEGADSYEIEQIGWNINTTNGRTSRVSAYEIELDNGKSVFLRVVTYEDIEGIAGIYLSDTTEFTASTNGYLPIVKVVLLVVSLLSIAFSIWMFVDCLRKKFKHKVLWAILIFLGISFTLTFGDSIGFKFMLGLMFQTNSIVADPSILSVNINLIVPVGAILYFAMRKKITASPTPVNESEELAEFLEGDSEAEKQEQTSNDAE